MTHSTLEPKNLADALCNSTDELVQAWYVRWRESRYPHPEITEAALKDKLPSHFRLIGEQLKKLANAESPEDLWLVSERLDPEVRVSQEIPIEEVVQEYRIAVETVRDWIEERNISVDFEEYSYFYSAMFELSAESVRRYAAHHSALLTQARSEYLAGVSHQMRNPLTTIGLLIGQLAHAESLQVRGRLFAQLQASLKRLSILVNNVMRLERFKPKELPVRSEPLQPASLVDYVMDENEHEAARKGLRFEIAMNRAISMKIDPDLFIDALGNLVQNAVKYTSSGYVRVEAEEEGDAVVFKVRDSGPGLTPERLKDLFKPTLTWKPGAGGVGIGLTVAQRAVEAQGGEIGVESRPGGGSTFWFRLPKIVRSQEESRSSETAA